MELADAVLDASFWINPEHSGLTVYLPEYFSLWVPPVVVGEITAPLHPGGDMAPAAQLFIDWLENGTISLVSPAVSLGQFDAGENQAIALALERGWLILMDDRYPYHFSRGPLGLAVVDSPAFAVFLFDQGRLTYAEAVVALRRSTCGRRIVRQALIGLESLRRRKENS